MEVSKEIYSSSKYGRIRIYCSMFSQQRVCLFKTALARISISCQHYDLLRFKGSHSNDYEPSSKTKMQGLLSRLPLRPGVPQGEAPTLRVSKWSSSTSRHVHQTLYLRHFIPTHEGSGLRQHLVHLWTKAIFYVQIDTCHCQGVYSVQLSHFPCKTLKTPEFTFGVIDGNASKL